ncbi:SusC/RagA family TonB-linked outer membrane protein [Butyricimonas paravirosa]|uniref:SusC/RagA family TonB-linked outer membrane protein n=1 Tax=Butyricimonas paravirosa TaxID=1472417 RepID=UPI00210AFE13|nr:SusC/RagA family TonB-linked outer membrane protein [Butyricimonas paravirosa]MCQ4873614.1 SusC/RagA family TonB-linked outer membrane protein [Butyricimonas paravirosa]
MKKKRGLGFLGKRKLQLSLLKMKVTLLLLVVSVLQSMAGVYSQTAKYDISLSGGKLENVFKMIEQKGEFTFLYSIEDVDHVSSININVKQAGLKEVLDICLASTKLTYEINGRLIVIRVRDEKPEDKMMIIKGSVKDKKGEPLPGVTIIEKGTSVGVASGINGEFTFTTTKRDSVFLIFSFVGMKTKVILWKGQKELKVVMEEDAQEMDEVVVTGYQTVKKSNMAGSVSTVKAEDLILNGTQSLEQALQGKLPGVVITNQDGLVGTRQKVRVRGTSTLLGSQDPVWVVDGIIQEDPLPFKATELTLFGKDPDNIDMIRNFVGSAIAWLNPSDIQDVTVLKDASATAIYGVKAANGVIVITTKKGSKGRMSLNYSGNFSIGSKITYDKMNLMNSKERVDVSREIFETGLVSSVGLDPVGYQGLLEQYLQEKISYTEFNAGVKKLETVNTDWFDLLYENPFSHSHNLSISGGSETTTYYASFGINKNNGTAKGNDSESYQGSVNVTSLFWDKLQVSAKVSGTVTKTTGFSKIDPYSYASKTSRVIAAFDEDGEYSYYKAQNGYKYNVLNELDNTGNKNTTNSINASINVTWEILKGLKFESTFGYNYSSSFGETWATEFSNYVSAIRGYNFGEYGPNDLKYKQSSLPHGGELSIAEYRNGSYTWRNQFSYVKNFGMHLITAMVGQECKSAKYDGLTETIYGYLPGRGKTVMNPPATIQDALGNIRENTLYSSRQRVSIKDNTSNTLSFYGAFTYTFDERYVLNASIRSDASNRFGQDKSARYQPVWSVGLRWNMGREHFLEGQDLLNEFSIRASFGYQGNANESAGPDLIAYMPSGSTGVSNVTGEYLLKIKSLPNPTLKWEKTKTVDLGIDFVFWKNKISGSFEYYHKKTSDAIINRQVPYEAGVLSMPMNGGSLTNSGWELGVSFAPVRTKNFLWSLGLNTSKNYNEVTSNLETNENWQEATSGSLYKKGYPVSGFWAFEFAGLSPENRTPLYNLDGVDKPEAVTDATQFMKYMGKLDPDFTAGINTTFKYKDLTLSASFNLQVGGKKFLAPIFDSEMSNNTPYEYNNLPKDLVKRWRKAGDEKITNIPSIPAKGKAFVDLANGSDYAYRMYNFSDIRVADASFLRCNNITLSYNLSNGWITKFAQNMGFTFSVSNPFIIVSHDYKGKDPEVATGSQPISQNYTFSVNISF